MRAPDDWASSLEDAFRMVGNAITLGRVTFVLALIALALAIFNTVWILT